MMMTTQRAMVNESEHSCGQLVMYCIYFGVFFVCKRSLSSHFKWIFMKLWLCIQKLAPVLTERIHSLEFIFFPNKFFGAEKKEPSREPVKEWASECMWCLLPVIRIEFNAYLFFALLLLWLRHTKPTSSIHANESTAPSPSFIPYAQSTLHKHFTFTRILQSSFGIPHAPFRQSLVLLLLLLSAMSVAWFYQHIVKGLWKIMMSLEKIFGIFMLMLLL